MYMLIGWCDGFGNDAYVKSVWKTRKEAIDHACIDEYMPDKLIEFEFGEEIDFDYSEAEPIYQEPAKELDYVSLACCFCNEEEFNLLHDADAEKEGYFKTGKCYIDWLVEHHKDWLQDYLNTHKEEYEDYDWFWKEVK